MNKDDLELLIAEERPVGDFLFDERKQCFTTDAEVVYQLIKLAENTFHSGEFIYFGGYDYTMDEYEKKTYYGTFEEVEKQLFQEYCEENAFMGYPVIYTHFRAEIVAQ